MNNKYLYTALLSSVIALASGAATAQLSEGELARLSQDLTPTGAEKAGNANGTIPAWDGGLTKAPVPFNREKGYVDPYAADKPLYTVTSANSAQYADKLGAGYKAMLSKFPDFKMIVYPTHRSAALPQAEYDQIRKEAANVKLADNGAGMVGYQRTTVPFPVPKQGLEVIYNHYVRYRTGEIHNYPTEMVVQGSGGFTPTHRESILVMASALNNPEPNRLYYTLLKITGPESVAGTVTLAHEPIDQTKETRLAWQYNPGQRRVLRAPEANYDTPVSTADGLRTNDMIDMYSGAPDKYNWKLIGKKEMIVPYNTYKLADRSLKYEEIAKAGHLNQDLLRYELHRVWVVEATLKPDARHIYSKREFYVDEDSWNILAVDLFDGNNGLWRMQEAHTLQRYDVLSNLQISDVSYDLQSQRYAVYGLENEEKPAEFGLKSKFTDFSPAALRRSGH